MLNFLIGLVIGSAIAFCIFALFYGSREQPEQIPAVEPMPCIRNMPQKTIKDWFAKLDEEVTEFKAEILKSADLDMETKDFEAPMPEMLFRIAEEGCDISTVVRSIDHALKIYTPVCQDAQKYVNRHNAERGRL